VKSSASYSVSHVGVWSQDPRSVCCEGAQAFLEGEITEREYREITSSLSPKDAGSPWAHLYAVLDNEPGYRADPYPRFL